MLRIVAPSLPIMAPTISAGTRILRERERERERKRERIIKTCIIII